MKKNIAIAALALLAGVVGLTSCRNASSLAKEINGDWSGTPVRFAKKTMVDGSFTPVFRFEQNGSQAGGNLELSAQISVTLPVNAPIDSAGTTAVSATAAGLATVRGSWVATDDDEVKLTFDMATLNIDIDPDVQFELADIWTSTDVPTVRTVSDAVTRTFLKEMNLGMTTALQKMDELDDIKIQDNLMKCEFLDSHQTLNRVYD